MIHNHLAQAAGGMFPKQTGKGNGQMRGAVAAGRHRSHRWDRAACNRQNTRAEYPAGPVLQQGCRLPPFCHQPLGRAFEYGKKNFKHLNNHPRTGPQKLVRTDYGFFQTLKENPNNKTSCISSPLLSSSLPASDTKAYINYFHTGKLFKARLFPYIPLTLIHCYFVKIRISTQTLFHDTTMYFRTTIDWKEIIYMF